MNKKEEEVLKQLRAIKQRAEIDLQIKPGYENYEVKNVKYYGKVNLTKKETGEQESFDLHIIEVSEIGDNTGNLEQIYYLNGQEIDFTELLINYESPEPIKDVVDKAEENKQKPENEKDKELDIQDLNQLEKKKEKEDGISNEKTKKIDEKEKRKNDLTGAKPKYVFQTIDIDKAYIDNWTTLRKGFELPVGVEKIAIATPLQKDENIISSDMTIYMLDSKGKILENVNGKTIRDYLEIDDATGNNPMYDDNTKLELEKYAEKNKGQTMRRFKSIKNPDLYLSAEQKKIGQYVEVYAGTRTRNGNDPVEIQLETDNVEIQTSFEMQKIISGYKGVYQKENIDKEADFHEAHGDDVSKIAKENADGNRLTRTNCDDDFIPNTKITWEQLSKLLKDKDIDELKKDFFDSFNGKNEKEIILKMQEENKKEISGENDREFFREGPWDSAKH